MNLASAFRAPFGGRYNPSQGLGKDLLWAGSFDAGTGTRVEDLVGRYPLSPLDYSVPPSWQVTPAGVASRSERSTNGQYFRNADFPPPTTCVSVLYVVRFVTIANAPQLFGQITDPWYLSTAGFCFGMGASTGTDIAFRVNNVSANYTGAAFVTGREYRLVGTYDGATVKFYVDGVLKQSASLTGAISNPSSPLQNGFYNNSGTYQHDDLFGAVAGRAWSDDDVWRISNDPWLLFDVPEMELDVVVAAAATDTFPAGHSRQFQNTLLRM